MSITACVTGHPRGQTLVESIVLMPLFLFFAFLLLQLGHLGIAMAIVNYSASSAAKQAVEQNDMTGSNLEQRVRSLFSAGLEFDSVRTSHDNDPITPNITVTTCGELPAYPFVGPILDNALQARGSGQGCTAGAKILVGPIALTGPPYKFIIQGESRARMNYNPKP